MKTPQTRLNPTDSPSHRSNPIECSFCLKPTALSAFAVATLFSAFSLQAQVVEVPADWAYPVGSANTEEPGFRGNARQARADTNLSATISRGNDHLMDLLIDPLTEAPYENTAVDKENFDVIDGFWPGDLAVNIDGSFIVPTVLNFSGDIGGEVQNPEDGGFTTETGFPDTTFPGLPGETDKSSFSYANGRNYSAEFIGFIHLPAGETTLTLRNDDASQLAIHPNDARDIFRLGLIEVTTNDPVDDRRVTVNVAQEGLYSIRVLVAQWMDSSALEFYSGGEGSQALVNAPAAGSPQLPEIQISHSGGDITLSWTPTAAILEESPDLIQPFDESFDQNNPQTFAASGSSFYQVRSISSPAGLAMWRSITTPTRPYVSLTVPTDGDSGVPLDANIVVTMQNLDGATPVMRVNETVVSFTTQVNGDETVLTHDPSTDFTGGETISVELDYGNTTSTWGFTAETGNKAILISGGGDTALKQRLAEDFNLDVTTYADSADPNIVAADAADARLIIHSSTVSSVAAEGIAFALRDLPVPIACVEGGNSDDYFLATATGNVPNSQPNVEIVILDSGHPTAGGLAAGTYPFVSPKEQAHFSVPYPEMTAVAQAPEYDGNMRVILSAVESGTEVDGGFFLHRNRRIFLGAIGNDGAAKLTPDGETVFNAAISWLLDGVPAEEP